MQAKDSVRARFCSPQFLRENFLRSVQIAVVAFEDGLVHGDAVFAPWKSLLKKSPKGKTSVYSVTLAALSGVYDDIFACVNNTSPYSVAEDWKHMKDARTNIDRKKLAGVIGDIVESIHLDSTFPATKSGKANPFEKIWRGDIAFPQQAGAKKKRKRGANKEAGGAQAAAVNHDDDEDNSSDDDFQQE